MIPFGAAHTYMAYIWEYPLPWGGGKGGLFSKWGFGLPNYWMLFVSCSSRRKLVFPNEFYLRTKHTHFKVFQYGICLATNCKAGGAALRSHHGGWPVCCHNIQPVKITFFRQVLRPCAPPPMHSEARLLEQKRAKFVNMRLEGASA